MASTSRSETASPARSTRSGPSTSSVRTAPAPRIAGEPWVAAAEKVSQELGVPLETVVIGPGRQVTDLYYDWARRREIEEGGVLLVRPDKHIGWRSVRLPAELLRRAWEGREPG